MSCVWHFIETLKYCKHPFNSHDYNLAVCKITPTTVLIMSKAMKQIEKIPNKISIDTARAQQENPICEH